MSATLGSNTTDQVGLANVSLDGLTGQTVTLSPEQAKKRVIRLSGTATGSNDVVFPVAEGDLGMWWIVQNVSGQNAVCKRSGETGVTIATTKNRILFWDGETNEDLEAAAPVQA